MNFVVRSGQAQSPRVRTALCVVGTRPEVIKMVPVVDALRRRDIAVSVIATGQQSDLLEAALREFDLSPTLALRHRSRGHSPAGLISHLVTRLDRAIQKVSPDCVIAQGDTTSTFASAMASFYRQVPFVHVEAGLRSDHLASPFPEEFHRRATAIAAALHCAPTWRAATNLRRENVPAERIQVTGNTVIDMLLQTAAQSPPSPADFPSQPTILLTAHRRENFGEGLLDAFAGIRSFLDMHPAFAAYVVMHPNPRASEAAKRALSGHSRVVLAQPLGYRDMVGAIQQAWCLVTDSGGLQEEAPALGKPVLVLRDVTERPEAVDEGVVRLVGTARHNVAHALAALASDDALYRRMARRVFPYGDGHAGERISQAILKSITPGRAPDAVMPATPFALQPR